MAFELDLDKYSFDELLDLFELKYDFTTEELKNAKRIVLKTHPDKSNLPKEYFMFFSKAYKTVVQINEFRNRSSKSKNADEYSQILDEAETDKQEIVAESKDNKGFAKFFNKMFDQMKNSTEEDEIGYSEWLKEGGEGDGKEGRYGGEGGDDATSMDALHANFDRLKSEKRHMVVYKDIEDVVDNISSGSQSLSGDAPTSYSNTTMFSRHNFVDVKEAYDNPVIPVTNQDYTDKKKYASIHELQQDRKSSASFSKELLDSQAKMYFSAKQKTDDEEGNHTAFKLIRQEEVSRKNDAVFWGHLKLLNDGK